MKRCINCGWFNLDSATHCEKCDEDAFAPLEPAEQPGSSVQEVPEKPVEPVNQPEPEISKGSSSRNNPMMSTVAMSAEEITPCDKRNVMAATVMDVSSVMDMGEDVQCPKCSYPIVGYMEYCPNCGATIRQSKLQEELPKPTVEISDLKATLKDIPEHLLAEDQETFRLVPVGRPGDPVITLHVGDVVTIGGQSYKFEK